MLRKALQYQLLLLRSRLRDRAHAPRSWWYPIFRIPEGDGLENHYQAISKTIEKYIFTILGFSFFCILTFLEADVNLIKKDATIKPPLTGLSMPFGSFSIIAPLILIAVNCYFHIFLGRWHAMRKLDRHHLSAHFFQMRHRTAGILSHFLFYWLVPVALMGMAVKSLPHPNAKIVFAICTGGWMLNLFLLIRRQDNPFRFYKNIGPWLIFLYLLGANIYSALYAIPFPFQRVVNLYRADLNKREITGFRLARADGREVNFQQARMRCTILSESNLMNVDLNRASLYRVDLSRSILLAADLRETRLLKSDFAGAILAFANLGGARVTGDFLSDLGGKTEASVLYLLTGQAATAGYTGPRSILDETACVTDAHWFKPPADPYETMGKAGLIEPQDVRSYVAHPDQFIYANFAGANMMAANLSGGDFRKSVFNGANLSHARLRDGRFMCSYFRRSLLIDADLSGADLSHADFSAANLHGTNWKNARLRDVDFRGAQFLTAKMLGEAASLSGARFDPSLRLELEEQFPDLLTEDRPATGRKGCNEDAKTLE